MFTKIYLQIVKNKNKLRFKVMKKILDYVKRAGKAYVKMCAENYVFRTTGDCTIYCDPTTGSVHICKTNRG